MKKGLFRTSLEMPPRKFTLYRVKVLFSRSAHSNVRSPHPRGPRWTTNGPLKFGRQGDGAQIFSGGSSCPFMD